MDTRRDFLKKAALLSGAAGLSGLLPASIARAMAIDPAAGSRFLDAEHVVFLMQENRSFDHTFGTLKGVRGFNDPRYITLPDGLPVWYQSNRKGETFAPFRLDIKNTRATWMNSLPHSWTNQVDARNEGRYDQWLNVKHSGHPEYADMPLTMGYYTREDIPFYYALADAFTVCDQHFCSSLTGTSPNRSYFWSGTIREEQQAASKPCVWNEDMDFGSLNWRTYPELLEKAGIPWKVYQNELSIPSGLEGEHDAWLANFTDNNFEFYAHFHPHLHPGFQEWLRQMKNDMPAMIAAEEKKLAALPPTDPARIQGEKALREKQEQFAKLERYRAEPDAFEKLTPFQQNLHKKAFSTNSGDPQYRSLAELSYSDQGTERTLQVPKGDVLHQFRQDVDSGKLPMVSWLVAPENFSDHPGAPWYGAWYVSEVMDILTKNPEVWKKTIFVLTYDENDGYFDHVPPFVAPDTREAGTGAASPGLDTRVEFVTRAQRAGGAIQGGEKALRESSIGLGYRVPLVIASPWSRGGYVNSEVFDHTSSLQFLEYFLEKKTGKPVTETNISAWRRTICGDLTSVFRTFDASPLAAEAFVAKDAFFQSVHQAQFRDLPADFRRVDRGGATAPGFSLVDSLQEKGIRPSNALPWLLGANGRFDKTERAFRIGFSVDRVISGTGGGAPFQVYAPGKFRKPGSVEFQSVRAWSYGVRSGSRLEDQWQLADFGQDGYHLQVYGPNGFFRDFAGGRMDPDLEILCNYETSGQTDESQGVYTGSIDFRFINKTAAPILLRITDRGYGAGPQSWKAAPGQTRLVIPLVNSHSWYDLTVTVDGDEGFSQRFAGRVETGREGFSDPLMGRVNA